ncbi:hypothetical protein VZT92_003337 [Zoarces viviparus]|uniref:Uncharacterized protein n=1 Tax=Zoarces viviparus TaxID=48416 RepID=A0AAW1G172_ZOAVI
MCSTTAATLISDTHKGADGRSVFPEVGASFVRRAVSGSKKKKTNPSRGPKRPFSIVEGRDKRESQHQSCSLHSRNSDI